MARMSRVWFLLVVVLSLALVGCTQNQEDRLSSEPTPVGGQVPIGDAEGNEAVISVDGSPTTDGATDAVSSDGSLPGQTTAEPYPAPTTVTETADIAVVPAAEPTTIAVGDIVTPTEVVPVPAEVTATDAVTNAVTDPATPPPPTETNYTVVAGDTLYSIAWSFNTTVEELRARNTLPDNLIYVGQVLTVPTQSASAPAPLSAPGTVIHEVQGGEWLWAIARQYNTTPEAIKAANGLVNDLIYPGQRLVIPTQ